ncbi:hypothetical protein NLI96_g7909 [Meripilus lineatus]|uniref:Cytochrome P450 n=1 Tax=Meripilus lineatus TaxID=2056292 RepID=A0AAD5YBL3_9APHY|nr:hypothetical protein NLI96_g7909 [Physisporinus lineatus]
MSASKIQNADNQASVLSGSMALAVVLGGALLLLLPHIFRKNLVDKDGNPIPPGPLLRYAFLRRYPERALHAWSKKYGPLFSLWMGNQLFVVISDARVARELYVAHGAIFSSRKNYFMKNQVILRGRGITASQYGEKWRQHRRIALRPMTPKAMQAYGHVLDYEARIMIRTLLNETRHVGLPINPTHYVRRYIFNNMLMLAFGTRTDTTADPLIERTLALATEFMGLTDFIEPLQKIPSYERYRGNRLHDNFIKVYGAMILRVKARMDAGEDVPNCLVKTLLDTKEEESLDWEDMCMLAATFTIGGVHSTSSIIHWFLALIPSYPEIQARAHEELDRVIGQERWPTAEDAQSLPYLRAIIKEVQRLHPPFWVPTPHYSTEDFVYNGMYIPKDTVVILDCYTLHHNEERYPDPFTFNPDRYLGDNSSCADSANLPDAMQRDHWTYGAGRRICPGIAPAEQMLWLAISRLLWSFTIRETPGEPISLKEYNGLFGRTPLPYRVELTPRHENLSSIVAGEKEITIKF